VALKWLPIIKTGQPIGKALMRLSMPTMSGIEVVTHHKDGSTNWEGFDAIINAHNVDLFIVGLPFDQDGKEQEMTFIAKSFARKLEKRYDIKTQMIDEYLSSSDAKNQLKYNHYHPNAKRGEVDKRSAQLILQTWLNEKRFD